MSAAAIPLVTIAIPTYNRASSFLPVALHSALRQRYPNLEILVADNGSADDTAALVQEIKDARIRYVRHAANIGAHRNYNYCLDAARGDYFMLLHDDDVIDENFVEACMEAVQRETRPGIIRTGVRVIDARGDVQHEVVNRVQGNSLGEFYRAWFAGRTAWYLVNTIFHTGQLRLEGGFRSPHHLSEDGFAIARLACFHRTDVPEVRASFRVHAGEKTMADPTSAVLWGREYLALLDCMCAWVDSSEAAAVRRAGRRFFARLAYKRAALLKSRNARLWAYAEVLRLFDYRCWPVHHSRAWKLFSQAGRFLTAATAPLGRAGAR